MFGYLTYLKNIFQFIVQMIQDNSITFEGGTLEAIFSFFFFFPPHIFLSYKILLMGKTSAFSKIHTILLSLLQALLYCESNAINYVLIPF